ncbi:MAG: DMT family transporter [Gemmatimonadetes bacterium]|nr:DMT family transporter [Gemmatimonadota bacterium]
MRGTGGYYTTMVGSRRNPWAPLALLGVAILWGTTFAAVKTGLADSSPLLFLGARFVIASVAALPFLRRGRGTRAALRAGLPLGIVYALGFAAQTIGLTTTSPSRSAFLTGLNVAIVPLWAALVLGRKPRPLSVLGLVVALPGMWLLTAPAAGGWTAGDSWTVACAVLFALHVVLVGRVGDRFHAGGLLVSQLVVTSGLALGGAPLLEEPHFRLSAPLVVALLVTALLGTVATTWLQLRFQPAIDPTRAGLIFATEPVFASFFAWLVFRETLPPTAWLGGAIILAGMALSEVGSAGAADPAGAPLAAAPRTESRP